MLLWALLFLVVAIVTGTFAFSGLALASAAVAQILFVVFALLFAGALIARFAKSRDR